MHFRWIISAVVASMIFFEGGLFASDLDEEQRIRKELNDVTWAYNQAEEALKAEEEKYPLYRICGEIINDVGDAIYLKGSAFSFSKMEDRKIDENIKVIQPDRRLIRELLGAVYYNTTSDEGNYGYIGTETGYNAFGFAVPVYVYAPYADLQELDSLQKQVRDMKFKKREIEFQLEKLLSQKASEEKAKRQKNEEDNFILSHSKYDIGVYYLRKNNIKKAMEYFKMELDQNPQNVLAYYWGGRISYLIGDYDSALSLFKLACGEESSGSVNDNAIKQIKQNNGANGITLENMYWRIGHLYGRMGNIELARKYLEKAVIIYVEDARREKVVRITSFKDVIWDLALIYEISGVNYKQKADLFFKALYDEYYLAGEFQSTRMTYINGRKKSIEPLNRSEYLSQSKWAEDK